MFFAFFIFFLFNIVLFDIGDLESGVGSGGWGLACSFRSLVRHTFEVSWFPRISDQSRSGDWSHTWSIHLLYHFPWLINNQLRSTDFTLCPDFWLVKQFLRNCRQNAGQIEFKSGWPNYFGPPQAGLTFCSAKLHFRCFLTFDWSSIFRVLADKPLIRLGPNFVG